MPSDDLIDSHSMPAIVLANPQLGENIGASARAMKNCGLTELHIITPRDGWPNPNAISMAASGADILERATLHEKSADALAPFTMIAATTARHRSVIKETLDPRQAAQRLIAHANDGGKSAILFGAERSGLDNDDIALADIIITAPLNPAFPSLNLGQAVLLAGWECRMAAMANIKLDKESVEAIPAESEKKQFFYKTLEDMLADGGFFANPDMRAAVMRNIMALFSRAGLTEQELKTLHGMVKAIRRSGNPPEN